MKLKTLLVCLGIYVEIGILWGEDQLGDLEGVRLSEVTPVWTSEGKKGDNP